MFTAIDVAGTGITTSQNWLDIISHNVSNLNTVRGGDEDAFRSVFVIARDRADGLGTETVALRRHGGEAPRVLQPGHPLADEDGYVTLPLVDLGVQMSDMILAQRALQANSRAVQAAQESYRASLNIGRQ